MKGKGVRLSSMLAQHQCKWLLSELGDFRIVRNVQSGAILMPAFVWPTIKERMPCTSHTCSATRTLTFGPVRTDPVAS